MMSISLASDIKEIMGLHAQCIQFEHKIEDLQQEKENMKQFYKDQIMMLETEISDLKKNSGISLRDHFAGLAMQGIVATSNNVHTIAKSAYYIAGAMLAERDEFDA